MLKFRRGVSEVVGALLIAFITVSAAVVYISMATGRAGRQVTSLADIMRTAERRQGQLLTSIYCYEKDGTVKVYIYNYGTVATTPTKIIVNGQEVNWTMKDAADGSSCNSIVPKALVEVSFPKPSSAPFDFLILTPEGVICSWRLTY